MKPVLLLLSLFFSLTGTAQELDGAWKLTEENGEKLTDKEVIKIYQDGYFSYGSREKDTNKFLEAGGGQFTSNPTVETSYIETYDFHTGDPELVGSNKTYSLTIEDDILTLLSSDNTTQVWERVSDREDELSGNWVITGRKQDGELNKMTPGARRTIKILGGGRFQWVAFNSETREFSGTGGGTYTAEDGKYVENIEFFSRDDNRVGARLEFDFEVRDGEWHHSGKSSKGDPIYEIWSPYREAYLKKVK